MTSVALRARFSTTTGVSNLHGRLTESKQSQEKDQVGLERFARSIPGLDGFDSWSWDTVWSGPLCPDGQDDLVSFNRVQKNVRFYGPSNFPMNMTWERLILLSLS